jgi:hydroxypyruvate isomerase
MHRRQLLSAAALAPLAATAQSSRPSFKLRYGPRIGWLGGKSVPDQISMYHAAGYPAFEHNGLPGNTPQEMRAIRQRMDETGMKMGTFVMNRGGWRTTALPDRSGHARFLEDIRKGVDYHKIVQNEVATVTTGIRVQNLTFAQQTQNCVEALKRAAEIVEKTKLVLVLEPLNEKVDHAGYFCVFSEHAAEIIGGVNHPQVKILFDIYHQQISEGNVINNLRQYWDMIGYIQTGDVPGRKEPYTGELNYQNIFKVIHQMGYTGILGLEHSLADPTPAGFEKATERYRMADNWS